MDFNLVPGMYDIKINYKTIDAEQWLRNVPVQSAKLCAYEVRLNLGQIKIQALDARNVPLEVSVSVYQAGTRQQVKKESGLSPGFNLKPGSYDLEVYFDLLKSTQWLHKVQVQDGNHLVYKVRFAMGQLTVMATDRGQERVFISAEVYHANTTDLVHRRTGSALKFALAPGAYDIKVSYRQTRAVQWIRGLQISDGQQVNKQIHF